MRFSELVKVSWQSMITYLKRSGSKLLILLVLIILEFLLGLGFFSFRSFNSPSTLNVYYKYKKDFSEDTRKEWEKKSAVLRRANMIWDIALLFLLAINMVLIIMLIRHPCLPQSLSADATIIRK